MMDYAQPDFYRFNEDSLKLVAELCQKFPKADRVLDAGAGCGVIGIELSLKMQVGEIHLLEVQKEFEAFIKKNLQDFVPDQKYSLSVSSFSQFYSQSKFDLIVSNPPYYLPGKGESSKNLNRGICRSFQIDGWMSLLELFEKNLSTSGEAWVVVKNHKEIKDVIERELIQRNLNSSSTSKDDILFYRFILKTE